MYMILMVHSLYIFFVYVSIVLLDLFLVFYIQIKMLTLLHSCDLVRLNKAEKRTIIFIRI